MQRSKVVRTSLVELNRRREATLAGDNTEFKLDAGVHAQIMTGELSSVLIRAIDFTSIASAKQSGAGWRPSGEIGV